MYKFDPAGEPLSTTFRAIALSQFDEILADLDNAVASPGEAVHEGRRRCKKLRGLLRLVRPGFPDFTKENAALRDAAAMLSHLRDADVLRHTIDELADRGTSGSDRLRALAARIAEPERVGQRHLSEFRAAILAIRDRAEKWSLASDDPAELVAGLRLTYRRAGRIMRKAARSRLAEHLHEWRKSTKNHGFHVDLLKRTAPDLLEDDLRTIEQLATCLGFHHDLAVLSDAITSAPERFGDAGDVSALRTALTERTPALERRAFELGRQIFAERPSAIARRFRTYWGSAR